MTNTKSSCPTCGLACAPADSGQGCPNCLLRLALTADEETDLAERQETQPPPLPSGLRTRFFADYEILDEIARGGMGVIYKARQLSLNRHVALKMILASHVFSSEARLRFRMEIEAIAQLSHPHIVPLYESGEHEGMHFFTMRLVEGGSLAEGILTGLPPRNRGSTDRQRPFLHASFTLANFLQVARAIHYAHQRGILHRDLKPSNILLDPRGDPHVADFGLAKILSQESGYTFTQSILGSPNYMPPEQAAGRAVQLTVAADVYGLGAILYELLTAQPPFKAATPIETLRKVLDDEPTPPRQIDPRVNADLETICLKCLRKEAAARYPSAEALAIELERWLDGRPILARPLGPVELTWHWCRRQPALALTLALSVVLLIALVAGTAIAGLRIHRAELQAAAHLQSSILSEVRTLRLGDELGGRTEGLRRIREGVALGNKQVFRQGARDEVLALMARTDVHFTVQPGLTGSPDPWQNLSDPACTKLATLINQAEVVLRSVSDGVELRRFALTDGPALRLEAFSADGRFLAIKHSNAFSVWDLETGHRCFVTHGTNQTFCFAPNRPLIVLHDAPGVLRALELPGAQPAELGGSLAGGDPERSYRWGHLALSPDSRTLAASRAGSAHVELLDMEGSRLPRRLTNSAACTAMAWSSDGALLAVAIANGRVPVWRARTGRLHMSISQKSAAPAHSIAFNPEGSLLAAAYDDRVLRLMDVTALRDVFAFPCDTHRIGFQRGGARVGPVLRGSELGWLDIERPSQFRELTTGSTDVELTACRFSPDGSWVACGTATDVVFCEAKAGGRLRQRHPFRMSSLAFDPRDTGLIAPGALGLHRWTLDRAGSSGLKLNEAEGLLPGPGWSVAAFSPEGDWFGAINAHLGTACLFDRTLTNRVAITGKHPGANTLAVSPEGRWLATGSSLDRQLKVWAAGSENERLTLPVGVAPQAVFSADGKWMVAFGDSFHLYATDSWKPAPALPFPEGSPLLGAAAFSPNGRILAVLCDRTMIQLFDLQTWEHLGLLRPASPTKMTGLAFSADGSQLAASGSTARLRIWDLRGIRRQLTELGLDWHLPPL